jgi:nucleoid-associated protein YgaU
MPTIPNLAPLPAPSVPTTTVAIATERAVPGSTHTVAAGDNLWLIATNYVAAAHNGTASDADVVDYWRRVIASNQKTLRSGDPNLIFPGELITLPAIEVGP